MTKGQIGNVQHIHVCGVSIPDNHRVDYAIYEAVYETTVLQVSAIWFYSVLHFSLVCQFDLKICSYIINDCWLNIICMN